jgi:hypothetical protein
MYKSVEETAGTAVDSCPLYMSHVEQLLNLGSSHKWARYWLFALQSSAANTWLRNVQWIAWIRTTLNGVA